MSAPREGVRPPASPVSTQVPRETKEAKTIMVLVVLAMFLFAIAESLAWQTTIGRMDVFSEMARAVFTTYIVPFEMLGFLLLAALIGALYVATREGGRDD